MNDLDRAKVADNFGDRLSNVLRLLNLKQRQFADSVGVSVSTVNYWVHGYNTPLVSAFDRIAKAVGEQGAKYLSGKSDRPPAPVLK